MLNDDLELYNLQRSYANTSYSPLSANNLIDAIQTKDGLDLRELIFFVLYYRKKRSTPYFEKRLRCLSRATEIHSTNNDQPGSHKWLDLVLHATCDMRLERMD